ncbi:MAG: hypothetical protein ACTHU0_01830 [Kofleriaceae bacterium]
MIGLFIALASLALGAMAATGWLLGARAGLSVRDRLGEHLATTGQRAAAAEARLDEVTFRAERTERELVHERELVALLREQHGELEARLAASERATEAAQLAARDAGATLDRATARQASQAAELASLRARFDADRAAGHREEARAVAEVQRVLAPLVERERLGAELAQLDVGSGTRGELPHVMDALARIGGFSSVVLADEVGLPLAVNSGASDGDGERLAGMWSMLLALADRVVLSGAPEPRAIVVHDTANQTLLHRLFTSCGNRFVLTAVSRGRSLSPEVLDPALGKLERILGGTPLAARSLPVAGRPLRASHP